MTELVGIGQADVEYIDGNDGARRGCVFLLSGLKSLVPIRPLPPGLKSLYPMLLYALPPGLKSPHPV